MFKIDANTKNLIDIRDDGNAWENSYTTPIQCDIGVVIADLDEIKNVCIGQIFSVQAINRRNGKIWLKRED